MDVFLENLDVFELEISLNDGFLEIACLSNEVDLFIYCCESSAIIFFDEDNC